MLRAVSWCVCALLLALTPVARVGAAGDRPLVFRDGVDDTFVTSFCGFPMQVDTTGTAVFHVFMDENGDFERAIITAPETRLTFTNLSTGKSVWTPSVNMVVEQANEDGTGTQSLRGLLWHLVVPGHGLITADVGRIDFQFTFDSDGNIVDEEVVFNAGIQEGQFLPTLCSVLG